MSEVQSPLVSIVMPATKTRFLAEAIDSALGQDYPNLEVVLLDDGSTDPAMRPLLESYAEREPERFRFVRHDNVGQSETINRGMKLARGEFAGYLSDDDLLLPGAVRRLAEALRSSPESVVAYPAYQVIDESGKVLDTITPTEYSRLESVRLHDSMVGAGALFRSQAFHQVGGWDTSMRYRADYYFWLSLGALGPFERIADPLAAWRYHPEAGTVAARGLQMSHESLRVLDRLYETPDLPQEFEEVRAEAYRNAFIQAAMTLSLGANAPSERFFVFDRHMPKISQANAAVSGPETMLGTQVAQQDAEIAHLRAQLAQRDEVIAYLGRPWWWRMARRLVPSSLRPTAKRLGRRMARSPSADGAQ